MNRMTQEGKAKLEKLIARVMKDGQARGIAVGIVNAAGEILYENYFGYRDAENKLPITRDTIFGMASVTKSFTALSIMQMQQDGLLKVDDPVSRYIPEFTNKNQSEPVKLWHLMCHSGGYFPLPRIVVDKTAKEMGIEDSVDEELIYREDFAEEGIRRVAGRLDAQTRFTGRPGQRMSYCNDGFGLLSDIVRRHSGYGSFAEYLDKKILKPIGMDRSNISFIRNSQDENAAILYSLENGTCHFYLLDPSSGYPEPPERKALSLNGRLIRLNEDTYESLLQTMADSLSWTVSSLRNMTSPYIISALPYPALTHEVFHLLAGCAFLIALVDLIWLFYHSLRHRREPLQLSGEAQQGQQDSSSEQPRTLISHRRKKH